MNDLQSVLDLLAASYNHAAAPIVTRNDPTYVKVERKAKDPKAKVAKAKEGQAIFGMALASAGTMTAQEYILSIRNAGKRPFKAYNALGGEIQVIKVSPRDVRPDTIKAIAAYCGYDPSGDFGGQYQAASSKASIEIGYRKTNGQTRQECRTQAAGQADQRKSWGVAKDENASRLAHLRSSETAIVDTILAAEKASKEAHAMACMALEEGQEEFAATCAGFAGKAQATVVIERARLANVQRDLLAIREGKVTFHQA